MTTFIQPSFAKGELGPALYGRVDTAAYTIGVRSARNMYVHNHGGMSNRPGLQFICPVKDHTIQPVLMDFQFKSTDTYILELGNQSMRFIRNDAQVLEAVDTITAATKANPCVITAGTHGWSNGDHIYIEGVVGMTELNGRWFKVANKTSTTAQLTSVYDGGATGINSSAYTTYSSAGTAGKVYEIATPWETADLKELKWTQSADTLTVTHNGYSVREITRTDHNAWTITEPTFAPSLADPTAVAASVNGANNGEYWKYKVTAIREETFEESLAGVNNTGLTIASTDNTSPVAVTISGHGLTDGDEVEITGLTEMTELNNRRFQITKVSTNSFTLNGEDGTSYTDESTGGSNPCRALFDGTGTLASPIGTTIPDNTITWAAVVGAVKYTIYRAKGGSGRYGFLDETSELVYNDNTAALKETDLGVSPPTARTPFLFANDYPGAVGYYQQRRVFGGSINNPDTSEYSQTGNQSNFTRALPSKASDAIAATLSSRQVNEIRHFVGGTDLMIFTDVSEWRVNSGDNQGFAAETIRQEPQTEWGSSHLKPVTIGGDILFVQENLTHVRTMSFDLVKDKFTGIDMTLLAPHIFETYTISSWAFAKTPDPVMYFVRSDGNAATMTFETDQEVLAWAQWDTDGEFEWTAAIRPSSTAIDVRPYFVVKRIINGNTVRFIEKLQDRRFTDVRDAFFVDSGLTYDVPLTISGSTAADPVVVTATSHGFSDGDEIDISNIQWTPAFDSLDNETNPDQLNGRRYFIADKTANTFTLFSNESGKPITAITRATPGVVTAPAHGFANGDIICINGISGMTEANNNVYKVANKTTNTFQLNTAAGASVNTSGFTAYTNGGNIFHATDGSAFAAYVSGGKARKAVSTISGLNHLEGESVVMLVDGAVDASKTVSGGSITLTRKASRVHVGLKYISDVETLDVESPDSGTVQGQPKKIAKVVVRLEKSRGLLIGPTSDLLIEWKQRNASENIGEPTAMLTGDAEIVLKPAWNSNGRLFMRQKNPLPFTLLAVIPNIEVGSR